MTYSVEMLRKARTFEPEDSRVSNRLRTALTLLESMGVKPTITHGTRTYWDWATNRDVHHCGLDGSGYRDCTIEWEPWVTDDMFSDAYNFAEKVISARGTFHVNTAYRGKQERVYRTREAALAAGRE